MNKSIQQKGEKITEEIEICDFCLRKIVKVTWLINMDVDYFCPYSLPNLIKVMEKNSLVEERRLFI